MKTLQFQSLDECIEVYGRENLIAIDVLSQIIFYVSKGVQPKYVSENQLKPGRITCWFLKAESAYAYKMWQDSNPKKKKEHDK